MNKVFFIQLIIDLSKDSSCSSEDDDSDDIPFSCLTGHGESKSRIYTHAPIANLLYHLGYHALTGNPSSMTLTPFAQPHWVALMRKEARKLQSS